MEKKPKLMADWLSLIMLLELIATMRKTMKEPLLSFPELLTTFQIVLISTSIGLSVQQL